MNYITIKFNQIKKYILSVFNNNNNNRDKKPYFFEQVTNNCMICNKPLTGSVKYLNGEVVMCRKCINYINVSNNYQ